jgi:putative hydrolase of the HAD superfamily
MADTLRAVLFDLDGTLMDHDAARVAGFEAHLAQWLPGAEASELAWLDEQWRVLEARHYDEYAAGHCSIQEQRRRRVRGMHEALGHALDSDEAADEWFAAYLGHYRAAWRAFEDAPPALDALVTVNPEIKLAVVTNGEGEPQRAKLTAIGLAERFPLVVASGEVGASKPDPAIFLLACERLGVDPAQAAHVGDRLDLDANGAAGAGLRGIWLDRPDSVYPRGSAHVAEGVVRVSTLRELSATLGA